MVLLKPSPVSAITAILSFTAAFCSLLIIGALWLSYIFSLAVILAALSSCIGIGFKFYNDNCCLDLLSLMNLINVATDQVIKIQIIGQV